MEIKFLLFAGVAFVFCVIFFAIGGYFYKDASDRIEFYEDEIGTWEEPNGVNYLNYEIDPEHPTYLKAKDNLKDAKADKENSAIWFVIGVIFILITLALVVMHFIVEKRADDKLGASFFVEGGGGNQRSAKQLHGRVS